MKKRDEGKLKMSRDYSLFVLYLCTIVLTSKILKAVYIAKKGENGFLKRCILFLC